jgi:hypothetical protein
VHDGLELAEASLAERMDAALHGLCQPLTVLQCRLAMGELVGGMDTLRQAIADALVECTRVNLAVGLMREILQHELQMDRDKQERTR